ncbi:MAG: protein translocase SEC61 complex subunit gamma [Candidatus Kariarchaeaceae archaeon]
MYEQPNRTLFGKLATFAKESARVFRVTKKPSKIEFSTILKVSLLGAGVIGLVGFIIYMIVTLI